MIKPVGIIGAMQCEVESLISSIENKETVNHANIDFHCGMLQGKEVVVAMCGVGKVCSAMTAQIMITKFNVSYVINTGVAGGLANGLNVCDIVLSTACFQHDFDITPLGYAKGAMPNGNDKTKATHYFADKTLLEKMKTASKKALVNGEKTLDGIIATGDTFVSDSALKKDLILNFNAAAAEMEGGAIAQVCAINNIPFLIVRAISDLADNSASMSYGDFEEIAAVNSAKMIKEFLALD